MGLDRLTVADLMVLRPEEFGWREDIGLVAVLDPGPLGSGDGTGLASLRDHVASRLDELPHFRSTIQAQPWGLGPPVWVDAAGFDVAAHVDVQPLTAHDADTDGARLTDLIDAVEVLRRRPFERGRPPWSLWLLPGLADGRIGLYVKVHHTLADGVAGVLMLGALLDLTAEPRHVDPAPWSPRPGPTRREVARDQAERTRDHVAELGRRLAHPSRFVRELLDAGRNVRQLMGLAPVTDTSVNRPIGLARHIEVIGAPLDDLRSAGHAVGATVNDVLLAAVAGGFRSLLGSRGELADGMELRALVPVSLHGRHDGSTAANDDATILVPLPVGIDDPSARLRTIAASTAALKRDAHPEPRGFLASTRTAERTFARRLDRQRTVNAYVADVPGPADVLYLAGARIERVFPVVPIVGNMTIGVGALSYAGTLGITVVADADACPDVAVFVAGVVDAFEGLGVVATHGR